jgi:hypothetical protein
VPDNESDEPTTSKPKTAQEVDQAIRETFRRRRDAQQAAAKRLVHREPTGEGEE